MRRHAAGVCVITLGTGEEVNGMAATAVTSFSMDPAIPPDLRQRHGLHSEGP